MTFTPTTADDLIDSREVIAAVEADPDGLDTQALIELAVQGETLEDWNYGCTLVRDSYFTEYAQELARDIGAAPSNEWPGRCIDWEQAARELQVDYTPLDFDGVTYWAR